MDVDKEKFIKQTDFNVERFKNFQKIHGRLQINQVINLIFF